MSELIHSLRGMPDILPDETAKWQAFESVWLSVMQQYGYREIRLPVLEKLSLFKRSIGEVTDIVEKEMFTFLDRDGEQIALRPEGTASCVRACLEHGLLYNQTQKLWYSGPMFRYERPQKGRYRQFHQMGLEAFGLPGADAELEQFLLVDRLWKTLGVHHLVTLELNNLGSAAARQVYRVELIRYLEQYQDVLDEDAKRRLYTNPLRILDSKNPNLQAIIAAAPALTAYCDPESTTQFTALCGLLDMLGLRYQINPRLVRGLDYYNGLVYEWVTDALGAQGTVCAGGRYDALIEQLGGRPTVGVGFALGVERLLLLRDTVQQTPEVGPSVYVVHQGDNSVGAAFKLGETLRDALPALPVVVHLGGGSLKNQFKKADKSGAAFALILAEDEIAAHTVSIKGLRQANEPQVTMSQSACGQWLAKQLK